MKLIFTGDVSFTGIYHDGVKSGISNEILGKELTKALKSDYLICNLEGPTTSKKSITRTDVNVTSPPESISLLHSLGFNIFNLANNHTFDVLDEGYEDTVELADKFKIKYFGAGKNIQEASEILYARKDSVVVALIGV
ncbi:MAG: CapA family protein, partial [Cyclobacteriaceae bacterium]